ncbi:MAG: pyridoxal phosphate-dependent aminotransferase [Planctomycetes bacterium]|nr:pyridoxal phosphate-dependent aminotransferase [Planctomycetota bacterium]
MKVTERVRRMKESSTLAVAARAAALKREGADVVAFGTGEPDFDTPANIKEAAERALRAGQTKYVLTPGTPEARAAVAAKLRDENGIACRPEHVSITAGAKHALYLVLQVLVEPGDDVVLPTPAWVSYRPLIELAGGRCIEVAGAMENGFKVTPAQLAAAMTPRTVAVILNSPSNPCGVAYSPDEVRALCEVVAAHPSASLVSDEIYEKLAYPEVTPGLRHFSPASIPAMADRTITLNGMSKAFAMTGWRIGYVCATGMGGAFMQELVKLQAQMTNNIPSFFMPAIVEALSAQSRPAVEKMRVEFARRARLVGDLVHAIPRFRSVAPDGAFYSFPSIAPCKKLTSPGGRRIVDGQSFAEALLAEVHVAVVPGADFGECAADHVRITFATDEATLRKGLSRIAEFTASLR